MAQQDSALSARQIEVDPENRGLTKGQIDIFAMGLFYNAHPNERPGHYSGDVWKFYRWDALTDVGKDPWRHKALHVYSTLVSYGMRLVSLDG